MGPITFVQLTMLFFKQQLTHWLENIHLLVGVTIGIESQHYTLSFPRMMNSLEKYNIFFSLQNSEGEELNMTTVFFGYIMH